ncbi:MAG: hypothetical protein PHR26_02115 [Candidatus ainarchaeum sp.]|nr:hypothetical protein [Candidatus ainarchaeum sp.]MDD3975574.1 hypothetical protein [Candidatus ainarchaeum sp.]
MTTVKGRKQEKKIGKYLNRTKNKAAKRLEEKNEKRKIAKTK